MTSKPTTIQSEIMMNSIQSWPTLEFQHGYNQTGYSRLCKEHLDPESFGRQFNIFSNITCQLFNIILRSKAVIKQACIMISQCLSLSLRHIRLRQILDKFMGIKSKISHGFKIDTGADVVNMRTSIRLASVFILALALLPFSAHAREWASWRGTDAEPRH